MGEENRVQIPQGLRGLPGRRWTVTPSIEANHRSRMETTPNAVLRSDQRELKNFVAPILTARYGQRENQVTVELGPADSTELAESLQQSGKNLYFGMDLSQPLLEKGRELMNEPGYEIAGATHWLSGRTRASHSQSQALEGLPE